MSADLLGTNGKVWRDAEDFKATVRSWAERVRVKPSRIQIQEMSRKWASCSPAGTVTFSSDLLEMDRAFGEAVIVHELVHLKVPNHGKLFRSLVRSYTKGKLADVSEERVASRPRGGPGEDR